MLKSLYLLLSIRPALAKRLLLFTGLGIWLGVVCVSATANDSQTGEQSKERTPWGSLMELMSAPDATTESARFSDPNELRKRIREQDSEKRQPYLEERLLRLGPLWQEFELPLEPGLGREALGPIYGLVQTPEHRLWRISPLYSQYTDPDLEMEEKEVLYPLFTLDRFGTEWQYQILQFFSWSGGTTVDEEIKKRQTIFPIYFKQRSTEPTNNYFGIIPFYGRVKNRFFRDESRWILFPLYVQTQKKGVVTDNYVLPLVHRREGPRVRGWQFWPLVGHETGEIGFRTNLVDEVEVLPGHDRWFVLWPFYLKEESGLGGENPTTNRYAFPWYLRSRSPASDYKWNFFFTHTTNRVEQFEERFMPWPFIGYARGPGKTMNRAFPIYGRAEKPGLQSSFFLWPIFIRRELSGETVYRRRDRVGFYLYNDLLLMDTSTGEQFRRRDLLPFFTWRQAPDGKTKLQVLAPLEPFLPNNKSIQRLYSPIWALWRDEKDPVTERRSQSLLWNLWRRDVHEDKSRTSALFGTLQTERREGRRTWRILGFPRPAKTEPTEE